ncbi:MAG TPA: hypothetical protein VJ895_02245 [Candidatus Nanoarchaeia archaeon]|nr:hypothetical protein [Candidatus Nanoarchaeia archaeon]
MGYSLQKKVEEKTIDILFELENELEIEIGEIPEVYYVGKNFDVYKTGMTKEYTNHIKKIKKSKEGFTFYPPGIIFIADLENYKIAEEVGHYMHFSNIEYKGETKEEFFCLKSLAEMIGYFSSKLIYSSRKNQFKKIPDFLPEEGDVEKFIYGLKKIANRNDEEFENGAHIQGYTMGEKMFNKYISGQLKKSSVRKIIINPLNKKNSSLHEFYKWKYQVLK